MTDALQTKPLSLEEGWFAVYKSGNRIQHHCSLDNDDMIAICLKLVATLARDGEGKEDSSKINLDKDDRKQIFRLLAATRLAG